MGIETLYNYPKITAIPDAWKRSSWTAIGILWILSNPLLSPVDCKIKQIHDQGSITHSIEKSGVDLFDRHIESADDNRPLLSSIINLVRKAVALIGIFIFVPPFGTLWHLVHCLYYAILCPSDKNLKEHSSSFAWDLIWTLSVCAIAYDLLKAEKSIWKDQDVTSFTHALSYLGRNWAYLGLMVSSLFVLWGGVSLLLGIEARNSFRLKQQFGLVGETGWLLTFNLSIDRPTIEKIPETNVVRLGGYFFNLRQEQAENILQEFKQIIELLNWGMDEQELEFFSENPAQLLLHLDRSFGESSTIISDGKALALNRETQLQQSIAKARRAFENYNLITAFLSEILPPYIRLASFHFIKETCRSYMAFQPIDLKAQQLFNDFKKALIGVKEKKIDAANWCTPVTMILEAKTPHQVLGVPIGADNQSCKQAYLTLMRQIHPDKVSINQREEATELFKVVDAAYQYLIEQQPAQPH